MSTCMECGRPFSGRSDKKFCDEQCRSAYHNTVRREELKCVNQTNRILLKNRKILCELMNAGIDSLSLLKLTESGFNHNYITSFDIKNGSTVLFCYEFSIVFDHVGSAHISNNHK